PAGAGKTPARRRPPAAPPRRWHWPRCTWTGTNLRRPAAGRSGPRRRCAHGRTSCSAWRRASPRGGRTRPRGAARRRGDSPGAPAPPGSAAGGGARAWVQVAGTDLARARRWQKRAEEALCARPDKLLGVAAGLVAARHHLAEGRGKAALELASRAST